MAKSKYVVRGAYGYDEAENSNADTHTEWEPSKTQQNQEEDANINTIARRFNLTGHLPLIDLPTLDAFDGIFDFHTAHNAIAEATSTFMQVPAEIRSKFDNDPGKFVNFCSDDKNYDQLREWGLAKPKAAQAAEAPTAGPTPAGAPGQPPGSPGAVGGDSKPATGGTPPKA